nr:hypothetical protein [Tanacetum cinerariifolium]
MARLTILICAIVKLIEKLAVGTVFVSKEDNEVPFEFKIKEGGSLLVVKLQMFFQLFFKEAEKEALIASGKSDNGIRRDANLTFGISDLVKLFLGREERITGQ